MKYLTLIVISLFTSACSVFGARTVEEPKYNVLVKDGDYEIRRYNKMVIAKTYVKGDYKKTTGESFKKIADYIFGNNTKKQEIAMTAPVAQEPKSEKIAMTAPVVQSKDKEGWYMYFIMPASYNLNDLPEPNAKEVTLEELDEQTVAVYTYSGFTSEKKLNKNSDKLSSWLQEKGYTPVSAAKSARYNHPLTLPFLRTNEVQIRVQK